MKGITFHEPGCPREGTNHLCCVSEGVKLGLDLALFGNAYVMNGKRVPPEDVTLVLSDHEVAEIQRVSAEVHGETTAEDTGTLFYGSKDFDCCTPERHRLYGTPESQGHLVENIVEMLEEAMHLEACWISDDETRCVCIIEKLRAVLPRCGHVETVGVKGRTRQCLSTVHPSAAHKHVFGTV